MKTAIAGSHAHYNLEYYLINAAKQLDHETDFYGFSEFVPKKIFTPTRMLLTRNYYFRRLSQKFLFIKKYNESLKQSLKNFKPDVMIVVKGEGISESTLKWIKTNLETKLVLWFPDEPHYFNTLTSKIAPLYDLVLTGGEPAIPRYQKLGIHNVYPINYGCDPTIHKKQTTDKSIDICFAGVYTKRRHEIISYLYEKGINVIVHGGFWNMSRKKFQTFSSAYGPELTKLYSKSKIVLNVRDKYGIAYGPNMRDFETPGCGAFMISEMAFGLSDCFKPDSEIVLFETKEELLEKVKYYLDSTCTRNEIALNGQKRAYSDHKYTDRLKQIVTALGEIK